jgi:glycosyltransferase involved in cell wall biosynthesis
VKVLCVYHDLGRGGGIDTYIETLARGFADDPDIEIVFCTAYEWVDKAGGRVHTVRSTAPCFDTVHWRPFDLPRIFKTALIAWRERPDVVHLHIGHFEHLFLRLLIGRVVYTYHGYGSLYQTTVYNDRSGKLRQLRSDTIKGRLRLIAKNHIRRLLRTFLAMTDTLIVVSTEERERLQSQRYLPSRPPARTIPNGVPVSSIKAAVAATDRVVLRQQLSIPNGHRVLLWFGRMASGKNPLLALEIAERLMDCNDLGPLVLLMAGTGPLTTEVERYAASSRHAESIRILGPSIIPPLLAITDLALFTSDAEGFGLGVLEATAALVPLVTTPVGVVGDLFPGEAAKRFTARVDDVAGFVDKAKALLRAPPDDISTMAQPFDVGSFVDKMRSVYLGGHL